MRELATKSELALCTIQDELRKLSAVGLIISWSNKYHRFYQPNRAHPLFSEIGRIVEVSSRLPPTKQSALDRASRRHSRRRRVSHLPGERAINWHLFSQSHKT